MRPPMARWGWKRPGCFLQHLCDKCSCPDGPEPSLYIRICFARADSHPLGHSLPMPCVTVEISRRWSLLDCVWWPGITAHQLVEQMLPCIRSTAQYPAIYFNPTSSFPLESHSWYICFCHLRGTDGFKTHSPWLCHCGTDYFPEFIAELQGCGSSMESRE